VLIVNSSFPCDFYGWINGLSLNPVEKMNKAKLIIAALMLIGLTGFLSWFAPSGMADDRHSGRGHSERKSSHGVSIQESDDEGNETTGQIAAWLLAGANLTVALSIVIRWTNRFFPLWPKVKSFLSNFNRFQKKHLMRLHYCLNPVIMGVALWHWFESRCKSTALPEWAIFLMALVIVTGVLVKFKLCLPGLRKSIHQVHTQPVIFITLILILTVGHMIVD
jgi:hypothetical protein